MAAVVKSDLVEEFLAPVELGYLEETDSERLESHFFASKVGGKPSWLRFKPLPPPDTMKCRVCLNPMAFLLQVYAPLTDKPSTFHRTLFVFLCRNPQCSIANQSENLFVLRSQLPRNNEFYSSEALYPDNFDENETSNVKRVETYSKTCVICGCLGEKQCSQCKNFAYCDKSHQLIHWKSIHKQECKENLQSKTFENPFLFPEYELTTEVEEFSEEHKEKERSEAERLKDYEKFVESHAKSLLGNAETEKIIEKDLEEIEPINKKKDKIFKHFQRRIEQNPEQVLRYQRKGEPLWASKCIPSPLDIPDCPLCGSPRVFEFQIMPHLLSYLDVDSVGQSIDWGTIAVYTCLDSCEIADEVGYVSEAAFKQDFAE